jgi:16S rRNA (adenine1518-N6/adenine1519-N6)-dimethyltransferase
VVRARKQLGQHFLHHRAILERIVDALDAPPDAQVLEIGPGQGGLTAILSERGFRVTAIEKDTGLAELVASRFPAVRVVIGDALEMDWHAQVPISPRFVIGNIPYNITSPLIGKALTPPLPVRIVFLVQEEVARRIGATPGHSEFGALSVGIQAVARAEKVFKVPAGAFHPRPRVDSAVIRLTPLADPLVSPEESAEFRRFVTGLFGFRRKQLVRGLRELTAWPAQRVQGLLESRGVEPSARPETLSPKAFVGLYRALIDGGTRFR